MIVADLTRRMMPGMPVWPGDPPLTAVPAADAGRDGCAVTRVTLGTHCGTHMDAPAHVLPGGRTLDRFPPERFLGWAVTARSRGPQITEADLQPVLESAVRAGFLLVHTGWDVHWGDADCFTGYPPLTEGAAALLAGSGLRCLGLDTPGPDAPGDASLPHHRALLGADILLVENLRGLDRLPDVPVRFQALPLALAGADGAPVRAVAYWE